MRERMGQLLLSATTRSMESWVATENVLQQLQEVWRVGQQRKMLSCSSYKKYGELGSNGKFVLQQLQEVWRVGQQRKMLSCSSYNSPVKEVDHGTLNMLSTMFHSQADLICEQLVDVCCVCHHRDQLKNTNMCNVS